MSNEPFDLSPTEHAWAEVAAYFMSLCRGGGRVPPYDHRLAVADFCNAATQVINERKFRPSKYINFDTGEVFCPPMELKSKMTEPWGFDQKVDLFECRVEVWQFGVAAAILKQIEAAKNPSIWSHAAYGLVSVGFTYFEMIGKTLNPNSKASGSAGDDFNYGFCNVYPHFTPANGVYTDKIPTAVGKWPPNSDPEILKVKAFRDRIRNGLYHLGYTKKGLWIHNDVGKPDFEIGQEADSSGTGLINVYRMNPHSTTRTIINHFPKFLGDIRDPGKGHQAKFLDFFDNYHKA